MMAKSTATAIANGTVSIACIAHSSAAAGIAAVVVTLNVQLHVTAKATRSLGDGDTAALSIVIAAVLLGATAIYD